MTWFMNFCAPFLPNDPTINIHRWFQTALLAVYTLLYAAIHAYYLFWGPPPLEQADQPNSAKRDELSQNSSNLSQHKELSIKCEDQANDSCIELKKTGTTWNSSDSAETPKTLENVTLKECELNCPLLYGHFAVAVAFSTMYTPYAEQSLAAALYALLSVPLLLANAYRRVYVVRALWTGMVLSLLFLLTSGLLQVGQSNWDTINSDCFANLYKPLYS